jgi:two-component system nitrogen regulation response regulator NtrX
MHVVMEEQGLGKNKSFHPDAVRFLQLYSWPGNVREIKNLVERLVIMIPREEVQGSDIRRFLDGPMEAGGNDSGSLHFSSLREARAAFEKQYIEKSLHENGWNITKAAEDLGVERSHLHRKMKLLQIEAGDDRIGAADPEERVSTQTDRNDA